MSRSQAPVRDLVLLADKALHSIQTHLMSHWQAWALAWCRSPEAGDDVASLELQVSRVADTGADTLPDASGWLMTGPGAGLWRHADDTSVNRFARQLVRRASGAFASDGDWALDAARKALADLESRWRDAAAATKPAANDAAAMLTDALRPTLGGVFVSAPVLGIHWLVTPALYRAWLPAGGGKVPLPAAIPGRLADVLRSCGGLPLALGIGHVDIAVTDLLELRVGDVVRFPALLEEPLPLTASKVDGQSEELMRGRLGHRDGRLAVQVVSRSRSL